MSIKKQGIKKLIIGLAAFITVSFFVYWPQKQGYSPNNFELIGLSAPVAWGLVGLLEILMNRSFSEMESWCNSLKVWQLEVIGLFVAVIAFIALLISAMIGARALGLI